MVAKMGRDVLSVRGEKGNERLKVLEGNIAVLPMSS
jgi:hypothetical protein